MNLNKMDKKPCSSKDVEVRKGPWTMEEDLILINYISKHGEGVWNTLAKAAGLKRTGKSCRLRWLNYLRPDVRRGNITPEEELLIMELHAKWGNRWSKIAKHLAGRTDNEIKNYWRTRIQKHIKQAETGQNSDQMNDQASTCTSQISGTTDTAADIYSPPFYNQPNDNSQYHHNYHHQQQQQQQHQEAFPGTTLMSTPMSTDNYWTMEDLWTMQLNGD